jgi:hypothetical protein
LNGNKILSDVNLLAYEKAELLFFPQDFPHVAHPNHSVSVRGQAPCYGIADRSPIIGCLLAVSPEALFFSRATQKR